MDLLLKTLAQAPLVAILAYIWYNTRKDMLAENKRLQERIREKDEQLKAFTEVFNKLAFSLELIKEKLK